MSISELIDGCAKARKSAQDFLYTKYSSRLYGVCLRYTGNRTEAQDVLQDSLVKIYKNIHKLSCDSEKVFYLWMHKITVNTALNYIRDNLRNSRSLDIDEQESELLGDTADESFSFYDNLLEIVDVARLLCFIQEMPCGYRTVFNLYALENYSHKEIADELNISVNTSKSQLFKARKMLAQRINETIEVKKIKMVI
jgi:RNA polymerase sigma-70 factor (ECF subfamily)